MSGAPTTRRNRTARSTMGDIRNSLYGSLSAAPHGGAPASHQRPSTSSAMLGSQPMAIDGNTANVSIEVASGSAGKGSIKGLIRRASVSLHDFIQRRTSVPDARLATPADGPTRRRSRSTHLSLRSRSPAVATDSRGMVTAQTGASHGQAESRPATNNFYTWRRRRQSVVFQREGGPLSLPLPMGHHTAASHPSNVPAFVGIFSSSPEHESDSGLEGIGSNTPAASPVPVPGSDSRPPVIPANTGGAARAAAAATFPSDLDPEPLPGMFPPPPKVSESTSDNESGIDVAVSSSELIVADATAHAGISNGDDHAMTELSITTIDFIAKLPSEIAIMIMAELDAVELHRASRVSRAWHRAARDHILWRDVFLREKTSTYATSRPIQPGAGHGIPTILPSSDCRELYRVKHELERNWKTAKAKSVYLNGHTDSIYCLQYDEQKIITGSRDKTIRVWDMKTYACRLVIAHSELYHDPNLLFDESGEAKHFALHDVWEAGNSSVPAVVTYPMHHTASVLCLQYDDNILVTGSSDASCIVYDMKAGFRPIRRLRHHTAAVLDLCFDERYIVTCSKDSTIVVWDRQSGEVLKQLRGHLGPVNAVQLRGNTIVSCSGDYRVKLWNIETGKAIREFLGHTKGLACTQFSEDGRFIASAGNDQAIRIWDANTGECLREIKAHVDLVRSLHIDSVSGRIISASYDRDIKAFDMETGEQVLGFPKWHQSWVLSAKSDYRRIISTGQDPKVLILDFGASVAGIEKLASDNDAAKICMPTKQTVPSGGDFRPAQEVPLLASGTSPTPDSATEAATPAPTIAHLYI